MAQRRPRPEDFDTEVEEGCCSVCNGSGEGMYDGTRCHSCRGTGTELYPVKATEPPADEEEEFKGAPV